MYIYSSFNIQKFSFFLLFIILLLAFLPPFQPPAPSLAPFHLDGPQNRVLTIGFVGFVTVTFSSIF